MKFPVPHDVKARTIPGTEGSKSTPTSTSSSATTRCAANTRRTRSGLRGLHYPEPLYPFDTIWDEAWYLALSQFNNRIFMVPPVRGVDHRIINGYVYSRRCR